MHDAALSLGAHRGNDAPGEVVGAYEIDLEFGAKDRGREIFHGAELAISAIVEKRRQPSAGAGEDSFRAGCDGGFTREIEIERLNLFHAFQPVCIFTGAGCREHAPASVAHHAGGCEADAGRRTCDENGAVALCHLPVNHLS